MRDKLRHCYYFISLFLGSRVSLEYVKKLQPFISHGLSYDEISYFSDRFIPLLAMKGRSQLSLAGCRKEKTRGEQEPG